MGSITNNVTVATTATMPTTKLKTTTTTIAATTTVMNPLQEDSADDLTNRFFASKKADDGSTSQSSGEASEEVIEDESPVMTAESEQTLCFARALMGWQPFTGAGESAVMQAMNGLDRPDPLATRDIITLLRVEEEAEEVADIHKYPGEILNSNSDIFVQRMQHFFVYTFPSLSLSLSLCCSCGRCVGRFVDGFSE